MVPDGVLDVASTLLWPTPSPRLADVGVTFEPGPKGIEIASKNLGRFLAVRVGVVFLTAQTRLYRIRLNVPGVRPGMQPAAGTN